MSETRPDTVLVTGGTGFVAGWVIAKLLQGGYRVRATIRSAAREAAARAAIANAAPDTSALDFVEADLTADAGWDEAMQGVDYVLHVASPLSGGDPDDPDSYVRPAVDGTLRVLRAAVNAGVKRIVLTSSAAASNAGVAGDSFTDETVWTDPAQWKSDGYRLSKVLAERAAWDFMKEHGDSRARDGQRGTEFVTILPTAIFGPVLTKATLGSVQVINRFLTGEMARIPRFGVAVCDVRDLADAHIRAMTTPEAAGERFLITGEFMWMEDIARTLRERLGERARKVPTKRMPDFALRLAARFKPELRTLLPLLGRSSRYSWAKAERILGFTPRPAADTVADTAESLLAP
ncbi:MAG: NAD-dependent epimerase/dehydratase family protein [Hyphomonadaceae bacterium]